MTKIFDEEKMRIESTAPAIRYAVAGRRAWRMAVAIPALACLTLLGLCPLQAQDEHRRKVPGLEKISPGYSHQAFSGRILSLDIKRSLLNVSAARGNGTEIFPFKKSVRVEKANGDRLALEELQPGTNVIVYYDQRGEHRNVKEIVVLQSPPARDKDQKTVPPS